MRFLTVTILGAAIGLALIWLGFNFRLGLHYFLSAPEAYLPAAIAGAVVALFVDYAYRKWT
jgi:hypothetical protein